MMEFSEWITDKFEKWSKETDGDRTAYAKWLGIPASSLSNWMNGGYKPRRETVAKLAEKLGFEIYPILGIQLPKAPTDEQLSVIAELIIALPEEEREPTREKIVNLLTDIINKYNLEKNS